MCKFKLGSFVPRASLPAELHPFPYFIATRSNKNMKQWWRGNEAKEFGIVARWWRGNEAKEFGIVARWWHYIPSLKLPHTHPIS